MRMRKNNNRRKKYRELLPFYIIKNAAEGDVEALHKVLEYYEGDIRRLATQVVYDEYGEAVLITKKVLQRTVGCKPFLIGCKQLNYFALYSYTFYRKVMMLYEN